ncbi:asparagine synthase (glutamine-hydrolyzing) [Synechococcus sp. CC9311]|uniref:asparagine synthase (glutamine-hydrolyzing) n=1 Tax=Synechococcus sp. (strain CC9311) TaxID=64471 RepID=UPI0000DDA9C4|nr:asparagine synthase (glutamine-hydrolyzing) [Synechococcus sp. CC9311]ABI46358.1 asparagine synthase (glutamine-hydrolyzing) [Synechococcus sp. CC9311]
MCGIFGGFSFEASAFSGELPVMMAKSILHRGPDNTGYWSNEEALLGNCRLSIIDLSKNGNQPFYSKNKDIVVVQNGEIYNYIELRDLLIGEGACFQSDSDTEVVLHAYAIWGPDFVSRLNGMFSIAIYDSRVSTAVLRLYRDRLGVKPLYYCIDGGCLWFGSEIKAILAAGVKANPNYNALRSYFALNYIPPPQTAFANIYHLQPGHSAAITKSGVKLNRYWDCNDIGLNEDITTAEAKSGIITLLDDAVRIRLRSDAPFGAFLSGGLDSSSVVGLMSLYKESPTKTFSIGFEDARYDETSYAEMASKRFGTYHSTKIMSENALDIWSKFIWHCDQPHGDISFIPTYQVSENASQEVKMVLTGDGGDELFAGYDKYASFFSGECDRSHPRWFSDYAQFTGLIEADMAKRLFKGEIKASFEENDPYAPITESMLRFGQDDHINKVLYADTVNLLPGNNLVKPDRMAMAHSLEVRSPFLDYRLVEYAFSLPGKMKLKGTETKYIYKMAVEELLGETLTWRKKQMFTVPVGDWFRGHLADFCSRILLDNRSLSRGLYAESVLREVIEDHTSARKNYTRLLRALISLEIWFRLFIDQDMSNLELITSK